MTIVILGSSKKSEVEFGTKFHKESDEYNFFSHKI